VRILGVDPGSVTTGYGVIDQQRGSLSLVLQGSIRTARNDELPARLLAIFRELTELIASTSPQQVAVESPFHGLNAKSLIQLAHARGVVLLAATSAGLPIFQYSPRSVKSAVVGYGGAEKQQVEHMVRLLVRGCDGLAIAADAADALAVAICHAHTARAVTAVPPRAAKSFG
jgi:crossover junction endodeoxyribonuclease RuvC